MAERLLLFLLFLTACTGNGPEVLLENEVVSVVRQPPPKDFDPGAFQQYHHVSAQGRERTVLNGGAVGIINYLAQTQVQWLQEEAPGFADVSLVAVLQNDTELDDPELLSGILAGLDARLVATGDTNHLVYLRAPEIREDIILATSLYPGDLTEAAALAQLAAAGVIVENTTGVPLRMDQETVDFYLPSLQTFFGDSLEQVDFRLEVKSFPGVRLAPRKE